MANGRGSESRRLLRWLWTSRRLDAMVARGLLVPASGLLRLAQGAMRRRGPPVDLRLPAIGAGALTFGGAGQELLLGWAARVLELAGQRPALLLASPDPATARIVGAAARAITFPGPDRPARAAEAVLAGASVLLLDRAFPYAPYALEAALGVVSAETAHAARWTLPAGPWRHPVTALRRADLVVVTRRRAGSDVAAALGNRLGAESGVPVAIARIGVARFRGMVTGTEHAPGALAGRRVVAASTAHDPSGFVAQAKATGAAVQVAAWPGREELRDEDVAWLAQASRKAEHVVVSARDALRLRERWPAMAPEPLVAEIGLAFEAGEPEARRVLLAAVSAPETF